MADLDHAQTLPLAGIAGHTPQPRLSRAEHHVLLLARKDPLSSIDGRSAGAAWLRLRLGWRPPTRLANPRLEALRRFAILVEHGRDDAAALRDIASAGFDPAQIAAIRQAMPHHEQAVGWSNRALGLIASSAWIATFFLANAKLEDREASFIVVGILGLEPLILLSGLLFGAEPRHGQRR